MSPVEIIIVVAAGIFLLWLWRGGGQPRAAAAQGACATPCCHRARGIGCFGVLGALLLAGMLIGFEVTTHRLGLLAPLLVLGIVAFAFIRRWGWIGGFFGLLFLGVLGAFTAAALWLADPCAARRSVTRGDAIVADWLDGPAGDWDRFTPYHEARVRAEAARESAARRRAEMRHHVETKRREIEARLARQGIVVDAQPGDDSAAGATLEVRLKPDTFAEGTVTPDALAATILTMIDMLTAKPDPSAARVSLPTLNDLQVRLAAGGSAPVHEMVRLVKRSRLGASSVAIDRIEIVPSGKNKRRERVRMDALIDVLVGVERDRSASGGTSNFSASIGEHNIALTIAPVTDAGIPVEGELAAAPNVAASADVTNPASAAAAAAVLPPAVPAAPLPAEAPTPAGEPAPIAAVSPPPPVAPEPAAADPTVPAELPSAAPPGPIVVAEPTASVGRGEWSDTELAYHLLMWTLPESLGGAARYQTAAPDVPPERAVEVAAVTTAEGPHEQVKAVAPPAEPAVEVSQESNIAEAPASAAAAQPVGSRPDWLEGKLAWLDDKGSYYMRRSTGRFFDSSEESREAVDDVLLEMTDEYAKRVLGAEAASHVDLSPELIRANFVESIFDEHGSIPGLPDETAWESHILMKFDWVDRELVERAWRQSVVAHNLRYTGAGTALVLALLGTVFSYLKLDTATRGFYSGRLKLVAGAMVAAITTLGVLLAAGSLTL